VAHHWRCDQNAVENDHAEISGSADSRYVKSSLQHSAALMAIVDSETVNSTTRGGIASKSVATRKGETVAQWPVRLRLTDQVSCVLPRAGKSCDGVRSRVSYASAPFWRWRWRP
jgi:hypothetical protein